MKCFLAVFGWDKGMTNKAASSSTYIHFSSQDKAKVRQLQVFEQFLHYGISARQIDIEVPPNNTPPLWYIEQHLLQRRPDCFAYLNLFGNTQDEDDYLCEDRGDRQKTLQQYRSFIEVGLESSKQQGGEQGRIAAIVIKTLQDGMNDSEID